ncbi:MAG: inositol monophosphatase [Bacteroidales bacterium]|nr:inositol monophosphatase [Bacteroidales bacterium]
MVNYKDICLRVNGLVLEVGEYIRNERETFKNNYVEVKGKNDFVTYVDKNSEKKLVEGLSEILPQAGYIAEEQTSTKKGDKYNWIIDPIDGTTNFIHGLTPHAISIALKEDDTIVVGEVYEIGLDECFYSWYGGKAFCNGNEISVSGAERISDSLIATGFPYYDYSKLDKFLATMGHLMQNSHGLRRLGSAATDLAYVAAGRFESFFEYGLKPWDVAAGAFLVQQAGGLVNDFQCGDNYIFGGEIIASNKQVHNEMIDVISKYML